MCRPWDIAAFKIREISRISHANLWAIVLAGGEGTRVRSFLKQLCGGSGLKQFSTIIGERSMLRCTSDRVERLVPTERILIVVGAHHRAEVEKQLPHWQRQKCYFSTGQSRYRARYTIAARPHNRPRSSSHGGGISIRSFCPR